MRLWHVQKYQAAGYIILRLLLSMTKGVKNTWRVENHRHHFEYLVLVWRYLAAQSVLPLTSLVVVVAIRSISDAVPLLFDMPTDGAAMDGLLAVAVADETGVLLAMAGGAVDACPLLNAEAECAFVAWEMDLEAFGCDVWLLWIRLLVCCCWLDWWLLVPTLTNDRPLINHDAGLKSLFKNCVPSISNEKNPMRTYWRISSNPSSSSISFVLDGSPPPDHSGLGLVGSDWTTWRSLVAMADSATNLSRTAGCCCGGMTRLELRNFTDGTVDDILLDEVLNQGLVDACCIIADGLLLLLWLLEKNGWL